MQQGANNGSSAQSDLFHADRGNSKRMENVWFPAFSAHITMGFERQPESLADDLPVVRISWFP